MRTDRLKGDLAVRTTAGAILGVSIAALTNVSELREDTLTWDASMMDLHSRSADWWFEL